ncbi:hypothetical protein [Dyella sp.]|uniref:hypothetical protein n=1 Tax=Dyella sp. TaxID=1869338 RepID=UPI00283BBA1D|nr:hypothetical protein [Dyella sp.]MDR3447496.1 hypothetical protein [Dyella sp.]
MRRLMLVAMIVSGWALHGCARAPTVLSGTDQQSLKSMALFSDDGSPRFVAYVACTSEDQSCALVDKAFATWADDRHVALHLVESSDAAFNDGVLSSAKGSGQPYRLAMQIDPLLVPSFFQFRGGMNAQGGYKPPRVGYKARIYVFDAKTGALLKDYPIHQEVTANPDSTANGYIRSEMGILISSIDPDYRMSSN